MKCERAKELFSEYLEGSIDYALTTTVRAHIDQCNDCRSDLKAFRGAWDMIGALPEIAPPSDFRHDVVMRAARMQHETRKVDKQGFLGVTWDYVFGRLLPARALAVACAGAILAMVLLNVPQSVFHGIVGTDRDAIVQKGRVPGTDEIQASPFDSGSKEDWQSRTRIGNALWVSVTSTEFCEGNSYYELNMNINNKALVRDVTNRIPAQVYVLPAGTYGLEPGQRKPMWSGNVLGDSPVQLTVPGISNSQGEPVPITLLITYQLRKMHFSKVVFIPNKDSRPSSDALGLSSGLAVGERNLYAVLQAISQDYSRVIIANGSMNRTPAVVDIGSDREDDTLRKVLKPIGLDWASIDKAVYVDRPFGAVEN